MRAMNSEFQRNLPADGGTEFPMSRNADAAIREAEPGDALQIASLLTQLGYPSTSDQVKERLAYWLPDPMSLILVAEQSRRLVGCLSLHAIPYFEQTGRWARIESLVVDASARGRGTGRSLVVAAEDAARRWDCRAVEVTSQRSRVGAHAFYARMGYADVCATSGRFFKKLVDADVSAPG
jgi:N-acetylglutamate synthase-like GNAT family acetyltransferase